MALVVLPLARASSESLTAVYARTFEKAAFGFAKVRAASASPSGWRAQPESQDRLLPHPRDASARDGLGVGAEGSPCAVC